MWFYALPLMVSDPISPIVQLAIRFLHVAPITALLRPAEPENSKSGGPAHAPSRSAFSPVAWGGAPLSGVWGRHSGYVGASACTPVEHSRTQDRPG